MRKNLFLVHTPFQLMNSLNIIDNYYSNETNEIAFLHHNMEKYENLVKIFNKTTKTYSYEFLYDEYKKKSILLIRLSLVYRLIKGKIDIKKAENKHVVYDSLFVPSENVGCNIVYNYFRNLNESLNLFVYDDGVGTYAKDYLTGKNHKVYQKISKLLFGSFFWRDINKIFCYQPELIDTVNLNIDKIKIVSSDRIDKLFSQSISDALVEKYSDSRIIYLDQGQIPLSYDNTTSFFEICKKNCSRNEVLLKNHPRVKPIYDCISFEIDNSGNTFESVLFSIDIEDKILVSMCSTSCLTPFILKGKYPYVIFLGMLNTHKYNDVFSSPYFQNVINNYEPNKIFLPRSIIELERVIKFCLDS